MPTHPRPTNRLIDSTSPYLLQHAHNPVLWHPWGTEALELARAQQKPIFLSIGYAACHWCHIMEREVFEKNEIAAIMNEHFINIKVDREERPDLDELYMMATQIMTGSGGWPMSVWLTPPSETGGLEPFYAGTYFPAEDGYGRPGFPKLERALADAWKNRRDDLQAQAARVVEAIKMHADESAAIAQGAALPATETLLATAMDQMADRFDETHGGLGGAPKFPPHQALLLWQKMHNLVSPVYLDKTLEGMMNGGIYDHVGGGFARYSTDARWLVPHFEKMLYDSAQLAPVYALASDANHRPEYARVARETLDFFLREMQNAQGAFYSSLDADSAGEEGLYYVWTIDDVHAALPQNADAALIIEHFGMTAQGNWHESPVVGGNVPAVASDAEALAKRHGGSTADMRKRLDVLLVAMRTYRDKRVRPGLDDKVLTAWNGLMISALAVCGRVLREPKYLEAAHRAIGFLLTHHMEGGRRLLRVSRNGQAHTDAFLDDHAYLLNGLMDLIDSTTPTSLPGTMARKRALELADTLIADFEDKENGGFYFTSPRHETLFARMKNAADNATPSANGVAIRALLRLARESGKERYREVALRAVAAFGQNLQRRPEYFPTILLALMEDDLTAGEKSRGPVPPMKAEPLQAESRQWHSALLKLSAENVEARAGEAFEVKVRVSIAAGYHIQANEPVDREAYRTVAKISGPVELKSQQWRYPPTEKFADGTSGYAAEVELTAACQAEGAAGRHGMRVALLAQLCSGNACLAPERVGAEFILTMTA